MRTFFLMMAFLPATAQADATIDFAKFQQILDDFSTYAEPLVRAEGAELRLTGTWNQELRPLSQGGAGGASASGGKRTGVAGISVVGGLARHPLITADALRFVLCHELGHFGRGLYDELGSDLFAAEICLPALLSARKEEPTAGSEFFEIDRRCEAAHPHSGAGVAQCRRTMRVGWSIARYSEFLWAQIKPNEKRLPLSFNLTERDLSETRDVPACRLLLLMAIGLGEPVPARCL